MPDIFALSADNPIRSRNTSYFLETFENPTENVESRTNPVLIIFVSISFLSATRIHAQTLYGLRDAQYVSCNATGLISMSDDDANLSIRNNALSNLLESRTAL